MGLLDRLFGRRRSTAQGHGQDDGQGYGQGYAPPQGHGRGYAPPQGYGAPVPGHGQPPAGGRGASSDQQAIERYRYLLRTAPPEQIEQAHAEAFAQLTPEQRRQVLAELSSQVPPHERTTSDDPRALARMATRAEMRSPGTLERSFSRGGTGMGGGIGMGGLIAGSLLTSIAGAFVGTAIADAMFDFDDSGQDLAGDGGDLGGEGGDYGGDYTDAADAGGGGDYVGDLGSAGDFGGGDFGGDFGDVV
ncbi:hypothetical protein [Quadrisphaera sp. DSM 44207]|uniref:hypothetical protein n=1 Tax=Quadrisphaera sp. DSM 44207 TaxID=1881057 RepID=UPI00088F3515|nr:hypothetical protein [Quadrisphaera sp. DSM 44207]SDQ88633.1 hypothetical protein SAMN05428996_3029 [Quadrisphaera sp. DSM 44207]